MQEYWPAVVIAVLLWLGALAIGMWIEADTDFVRGLRRRRRERVLHGLLGETGSAKGRREFVDAVLGLPTPPPAPARRGHILSPR